MSEEIRALIFLTAIIAAPLFFFLRFSSHIALKKNVIIWIQVWVLTTLLAFFAPNFWLYALFLAFGLYYYTRNKPILKISLFFVLLPAIPAATILIPSFGLVNYVFHIGHHHVLTLILLLPLLLKRSRGIKTNKSINILIFSYFLLVLGISFRDSGVTEVMRIGFIKAIIMLIPFYAISKSIHNSEDIKTVFYAIIFGIFIQSVVGIAETLKTWHIYNSAVMSLGLDWGIGGYLSRNNLLRASAALGHPILLGYVSSIGLGLFLNFVPTENKKMRPLFWFGIAIFVGSMIATLSRGPWIGAALIVLVFIMTGRKAIGKITKLAAVTFLALVMLSMTPRGQSFINLIPFMSADDSIHAVSTINYRQRLLEQSWIVIQRNLFFGSDNYLETPEMETMRQGEGIIDIVNSYLQVALETGLVGLGFFLLIFISIAIRLYKLLPILKSNIKYKELLVQNRAMFATVVGIMLTIFTVSSIGITPIYYWSILALACAFIKVAKTEILQHIMSIKQRRPVP
ncbi:MAG: O-antigen ligase family protein [Emcibacteraceae bacterium]|nr:O-antigen ligase family protein [Emcibacteraceae bacterium]